MKRIKTIKAADIEKALREEFGDKILQSADGFCYKLRLFTKLGTLRISPCDGAIRTVFDEVPKCEPIGAPLNQYSGKWNFEGIDEVHQLGRALHWIGRIV